MRAIVLALSLIANAALAWVIFLQPGTQASSPEAAGGETARTPGKEAANDPLAPSAAELAQMALSAKEASGLRAVARLFDTRDLPTLARQLRASGLDEASVGEVIRTLARERFAAHWQEQSRQIAKTPFWKSLRPSDYESEESKEATRQYRELVREALGPGADTPGTDSAAMVPLGLEELSGEKRTATLKIVKDYDELRNQIMMKAISTGSRLALTTEDTERLNYLEKQKAEDLGKVLTSLELENYYIRNSPASEILRMQLAGFSPTEAEFRTLFRLLQQTDSPSTMSAAVADYTQQSKTLQSFQDQIATYFGPERAAEYKLATDPATSNLTRLVTRLELPLSTVPQLSQISQDAKTRIGAIQADTALSPAEKRAQLTALQTDHTRRVTALLGPTGAAAYNTVSGNPFRTLLTTPSR